MVIDYVTLVVVLLLNDFFTPSSVLCLFHYLFTIYYTLEKIFCSLNLP